MITVKNGQVLVVPPLNRLQVQIDQAARAREALEAIDRAHIAVAKLHVLYADSQGFGTYLVELESRLRAEQYLLATRMEEEVS